MGGRRGEEDSQPSGHEMMLKEVMLLESVENEGPEGLWVKVERVGMAGCRRLGGSGWGGLCPLALVLSPAVAMWGLPESGWVEGLAVPRRVTVTPARRGHGPRADPVTPRGSGTGWARSWAGNPATDPTDGFDRVPRGEAAPGEGWHQRRGDTRTGVPTPGPLPTEADPPPSAVLGILRGCSLGTPQGAGRWDVMPPSPQAHGGICPNASTPA